MSSIAKNVSKYVKGCHICQMSKASRSVKRYQQIYICHKCVKLGLTCQKCQKVSKNRSKGQMSKYIKEYQICQRMS